MPRSAIHPHDAAKVDDAGWARIVGWAPDPRVVAIGETGLDYDRVLQPDRGPAGQPAAQPRARRSRPASRRSCTAARRPAGAMPRTPSSPSCARRGWAARPGPRRSATGRRPSSTRSPVRPTTPREVIDLGLAVSFSGLVFRAGEEASATVAAIVPADRCWSRPIRRSWPRRARHARATRPSGSASQPRGWRSAAGRHGAALGPVLVAAYDRTFPSARRAA